MRIPKVRWSAFPLGVRYSKSGEGVVVTGTLARSSQYTCTDTEEAGYSAHSKNYTCPTNTKSSQAKFLFLFFSFSLGFKRRGGGFLFFWFSWVFFLFSFCFLGGHSQNG